MDSKFLAAANIINRAYDVSSTYDSHKKYDYMVVYDDDITAVLKSMQTFWRIKLNNPQAKLVTVGGEGLLATAFKVMRLALRLRFGRQKAASLHKESEGQRLKRVAMALGVPEKDIILLDKGKNTTQNLQEISNLPYVDGKPAKMLVVSTQRLAMVFKQSAEFQCNLHPDKFGCKPLDYDMYVIHQDVEETLRWYNFQKAGKGRVVLHLYASLVRRFEVYDGKFLIKPFEPFPELKKADAMLRNRFLIKQRVGGLKMLRAYCQYIPIVWDIFWHAEDYVYDEAKAIALAEPFG